jgi:predicted metalloprotease with PDZ domain
MNKLHAGTKPRLVFSSAILIFCFLAAHFASAEVRYVISLADPERHRVQVRMEIPPGARSHELQLPVWNALYQVRDFSQYMDWIRAEGEDRQPLPLAELNKSRWRIDNTDRGGRVVYEMFSNDPGSYGSQLNSQHAFFNLAEILLYSDDLRNEPAKVEIANIPRAWKIATPLPSERTGYIAPNYDRLVDSPMEIANFEERDFAGACGTYRVILDQEQLPGVARLDPQAVFVSMIPPLQRVVTTASAWMNDCPFQSYMFIYHASSAPGTGGMEHAYSTAITLPAKYFGSSLDDLIGITSHEFFHLWDVKRIRPQSLEPVDYTKENYTTALWFSEGVDSTVGEYIRLRAHLIAEDQYLNHLSEEITNLESRPAHLTQSVEQSSIDAWLEKYPYYGLPERSISYYNKGELLGVLLDLAMRETSHDRQSLRELFRWMNERYAKQGKFFADSPAILEAAETMSHADLHEFFEKYVTGTDEIPWDKFFARVGLHVVRTEVRMADPGFEAVQKFDQPTVVVEVEPGSAAQDAGLRRGDVILRVNGQRIGRDIEKVIANLAPGETVHVSMARAGEEHELEWRLGSRRQTVFQVRDLPNVTPQEHQRRAAWLFGERETSSQ